MALVLQGYLKEAHIPGGNGRIRQWGMFKWTGSDVTGELRCNMRRVESVQMTRLTAPNTDEHDHVDETQVEGVIGVPATGSLTIGRVGTATADAVVMYEIIGE